MNEYVPVWCKSNFSFLEGASHPEELVEACTDFGIPALALTDRNGVYGIVEAHTKARELGIKLLIGSEVTLLDGSTIVLIASNRQGYRNLTRLLTLGRLRSEKGESVVRWHEVCEHAEGNLALWGGDQSLLIAEENPIAVTSDLRDAFSDRLYAMLTRHCRQEEIHQEARLLARAQKAAIPVAAATEVLYHKPSRRNLQDILTCIRHRVPISQAGRKIKPNAEHALKSPAAFEALFADDLITIERTREIADRCDFSLKNLHYRYPSEKLPDGTTSSEWLHKLTFEGAQGRYEGEVPEEIKRQLQKELSLIDKLEYCGYFLTMREIVRFCQEKEILCQGRGSAANSAVCYCLGITSVDPVRMGLLFERFLSQERAEPPDIDLDIEHNRREEVIQHVYQKYGRSHAAMVANFIRYRSRSAVREVGKALGIAETTLDRLSKLLSTFGGPTPQAFLQAGLDPNSEVNHHLLRLSSEILDFPRHLSIHPGGFLLGHEPVSDLVPIENASMPDRTVIQWDKNSIEELGLFKVDLLGLGALHQLHLGFDLLEKHYDERFTMANIPKQDHATFEMASKADTVGVFQIESRAQMAMLPRLKPETYYDLVIEISIVRPGPITGGMVHPYLRRRSGAEPVVYPHPCLEPVLKKTLGIPLFQEQVIRLAMVAADYTPGEADQLRRDMAAWRRKGRIDRHRQRLVDRMMKKGIEREFAERVFEQIRGFGEYGFPESHAASFALITYASSWMKCHYPEVFACSLLNAQPMGFYSPATIIDDAKRHGVLLLSVNVTKSQWDCTLEATFEGEIPFAIRTGLRFLKGLSVKHGEKILQERERRSFLSVEEFTDRMRFDKRTMARLAEAGALSELDSNRRSAIWRVRGRAQARIEPVLSAEIARERTPRFSKLDSFETIQWDYRATGNSSHGHPLAPLRPELTRRRLPDAREVSNMTNNKRVHYAGLVICRQRPSTASGVVFMTMEDETGFVNLVIWSAVFARYVVLIKTTSFLGVTGKLQAQDGVTHVIAAKFWTPSIPLRLEKVQSYDFH